MIGGSVALYVRGHAGRKDGISRRKMSGLAFFHPKKKSPEGHSGDCC